MYSYGKVIIVRPNVRALPMGALTHTGERTYCWLDENGKAMRTEVQTGVNDGDWIEVTNWLRNAATPATVQNVGLDEPMKVAEAPKPPVNVDAGAAWTPFDGSERVILGDLSVLSDGGPVQVSSAGVTSMPGEREMKIASDGPDAPVQK